MLAFVACKRNEVMFTYSPETPRAGQTIRFSNQTEEGEEWAWDFGDNTTSTSKSPVKTYKLPGEYTVTLKVDNKLARTYTKTVTVIDTVPCITLGDSIVRYFEPVDIKVDVYNRYNYTLTYAWELPENALILSGNKQSNKMSVCFKNADENVTIRCHLTQGSKEMDLQKTFFVQEQAARSIVLAAPGQLLHQRIFLNGFEDATGYDKAISTLVNQPSAIQVQGDLLYTFNGDNTASGCISSLNLTSGASAVHVRNANAGDGYGFYHGTIISDMFYWTVGDLIYRAPVSSIVQSFTAGGAYLLCQASQIGQSAGLTSGGIARYNNIFLYAYGQGIHRFLESEIGGTPATPAILTDKTIRCFGIDAVTQKIYFVAEDGLCVANMDGQKVQVIDTHANGNCVAIDADDNYLFWTTDQGVFYMPLIQASSNLFDKDKIQQLNTLGTITAIAIDKTSRIAK